VGWAWLGCLAAPNPYEAPGGQETADACERLLALLPPLELVAFTGKKGLDHAPQRIDVALDHTGLSPHQALGFAQPVQYIRTILFAVEIPWQPQGKLGPEPR
jgi:hypothetical protein